MNSNNQYDFAIIGMGAAGLNLALAMANTESLSNKKIVLIDKEMKDKDDHTWCYWDLKNSNPPYISKSWETAQVFGLGKSIELKLHPYQYNMVQSKDFYSYCHQILESKENIDIVIGDVVSVDPLKDEVQVGISDQPAIYAKHVFDSRLPDMRDLRKSVKLVQHFKGVRIQTDKPVFDPHSFVMMDYRYKDGDGCSFMYVLPSSKNEALIEFTYFDREVVEEVVYDEFIERYIQEELKISNFQVLASEMGQIPMSSYPFHTHNTPMISKIGTAGGWVKPSSGYSFRNAQKNSVAIVENIIAGRSYLDGIHSSRHRWYDKIMLRVLRERNDLGEELFFGLYSKRSIQRTFRFLDEESSLFDDLAIIAAFPPGPFIRAVFSS